MPWTPLAVDSLGTGLGGDALRLLDVLVREGFVQRDPQTKRYTLGTETFVLGAAAAARFDPRPIVRPALIRLASAFHDSTILSIPRGAESVCVDLELGSFPIRANYLEIGSRRPLGAGAGNSPTEVLVAAYEKLGIATGIDLDGVLSAANDTALGYITRLPWMDRASIVQGYAGVYSSFLLHAERAAARYGVAAHDILRRAGEKGYVGGQEDLMIELAIELASQRQEMPA